jgi:hypothetical protein
VTVAAVQLGLRHQAKLQVKQSRRTAQIFDSASFENSVGLGDGRCRDDDARCAHRHIERGAHGVKGFVLGRRQRIAQAAVLQGDTGIIALGPFHHHFVEQIFETHEFRAEAGDRAPDFADPFAFWRNERVGPRDEGALGVGLRHEPISNFLGLPDDRTVPDSPSLPEEGIIVVVRVG